MVDVPLAHLDRPFDYAVPVELAEAVQVGSRVRVRFAGRLVDAYVLTLGAGDPQFGGTLLPIQRAVGEAVLSIETSRLCRAVADRYAGSFVDVVRLAVPPRHGGAESAPRPPAPIDPLPEPHDETGAGWGRYVHGRQFLDAVREGKAARAAWSALPGEDWAARMADAAAAALRGGRGSTLVVPDARDLARLDAALTHALGKGRHVCLSAGLGPSARYRRFLAVKRGDVQVVAGTRAAAYAPVRSLGLAAIWDDGDDVLAEQRSPYPHVRDVLALRSTLEGAALLIGGHARTAETAMLVASGWAQPIAASRAVLRTAAPSIRATGDDVELARDPGAVAARLPSLAWRTAREALAAGRPVLVQVPRSGHLLALSCRFDGTPARCRHCAGPLSGRGSGASGGSAIQCRWCGRPATDWQCPACGRNHLRAGVIGASRTAEEIGRAFPGATVRQSGGDAVIDSVPDGPSIVVATPGAEPVADAGYGAALLLDGWAMLGRADLRAGEETLRRWMGAAALVRPGGPVIVGADAAIPVVQALIRWDAAGFADRELAERIELGFPPAVRMASLTGAPDAIRELVEASRLPASHQLLGPVPLPAVEHGPRGARGLPGASRDPQGAARGDAGPLERLLVRVPRSDGVALATALHAGAATRSARKAADPVRIELDPRQII
ncbi:MAG: primosome assembly protein PriA [Pseudonocardiales bacterium]|nr:primosome assembly protein PriA [Pseudonocardiales bacterium]